MNHQDFDKQTQVDHHGAADANSVASADGRASAASNVPTLTPENVTDASAEGQPRSALLVALIGSTAAGWYLSVLMHGVGYIAAALMFAWLGLSIVPPSPTSDSVPLRAALADETIEDEFPALEITQAVGPRQEEAVNSLQQLANLLEIDDRGQIDTVVADARLATVGSADAEDVSGQNSPFFKVPDSGLAVTRGSFTAWTDPAHPAPGESYQVIVEVRLPRKLNRYRLTDLSGRVVGTDKYSQRLPFDSRRPYAARVTAGAPVETVKRNTVIDVTDERLQLAIKVPGARDLVKDTIHIKSKRLREEQKLVLVFGSSRQSESEDDEEE